jgi:hypothetical protein
VLSPLYVVPLSQAGPPISLPDDLAPAGSAGVFVRTAFSPHTVSALDRSTPCAIDPRRRKSHAIRVIIALFIYSFTFFFNFLSFHNS